MTTAHAINIHEALPGMVCGHGRAVVSVGMDEHSHIIVGRITGTMHYEMSVFKKQSGLEMYVHQCKCGSHFFQTGTATQSAVCLRCHTVFNVEVKGQS